MFKRLRSLLSKNKDKEMTSQSNTEVVLPSTINTAGSTISISGATSVTVPTGATLTATAYGPTWTTATAYTGVPYPNVATTGYATTGFTTYMPPPINNILTLNTGTKEIVRLTKDGEVIWNEEINVDEAAEAFARSMTLGAEFQSGITKSTKLKMRDSVFEDLIEIAKTKGALTADDLTFLLQSSKIVEKLKGGKD